MSVFEFMASAIWQPILIVFAVGFAFQEYGMHAHGIVDYIVLAILAALVGAFVGGIVGKIIDLGARGVIAIQS